MNVPLKGPIFWPTIPTLPPDSYEVAQLILQHKALPSCMPRPMRGILRALGFEVSHRNIGPRLHRLVRVSYPEGWRVVPRMENKEFLLLTVLDPKNRRRCRIRIGNGDQATRASRTHMQPIHYFGRQVFTYDKKGRDTRDPNQIAHHAIWITADQQPFHLIGFIGRDGSESELNARANEWMHTNYPDFRNHLAYWDTQP